jgi:NADH:ubiquinone oxidoreductase subunit F (NADH-binding)/(2Fe-2S) ferredoxin
MPRLETAADLERVRREIRENIEMRQQTEPLITVGMGTCGLTAGAGKVMEAIRDGLSQRGLDVRVKAVGCIGVCSREPLVDIQRPGEPHVTYADVRPDRVSRLIDEHLLGGRVVEEWMFGCLNPRVLYREPDETIPSWYEGIPFYDRQKRIAMRHCGLIDPLSIEEYIAFGGYSALAKALFSMTSEQVITELKDSGLRGRGGAGFPAGLKWEFTRKAPGDVKYVLANGNEGDPGAYMDRSLMEGDPYNIIEGLTIAAYAIGSHQGYIYVKDEYYRAVNSLWTAIRKAEEYGLLGQNILGSGFDLNIQIARGGGAYVCGESSALMVSVAGRVGEPRAKQHLHATDIGLWERPSSLNNVETLSNVAIIINNGGEWYANIGTARSKGTKAFSLVGNIQNTGLVEVPMGTTLREIIYDIGGGIPRGKKFKAMQAGGPSGGCVPASQLDLQVDYEQLGEAGSMISSGMVIMDENTCMVDMARYFVDFLRDESCGKCVACREGIRQMVGILTDITEGRGKEGDVELLEELGTVVKDISLCGLGQTAPNPVLSTIQHFRDEYDAHIREQRCPAGVCDFGAS